MKSTLLIMLFAVGFFTTNALAASSAKAMCALQHAQYTTGGTEGDDGIGTCLDQLAVLRILTKTPAGDFTTSSVDQIVVSDNEGDTTCVRNLQKEAAASLQLMNEARELVSQGRCDSIENSLN